MDWVSPAIGAVALVTAFVILPGSFRIRVRRALRSLMAHDPYGGGQR